jgi:predicted small lipoprotein YifL
MGIISACFSAAACGGSKAPLELNTAKIVAKKKKAVFFYGFSRLLNLTSV